MDHTISFNTSYGYKTTFAYIREIRNGNIDESVLNKQCNLKLNCGYYSFAEIPKSYNRIIGVTGTLKDLNKELMDIIISDYKV